MLYSPPVSPQSAHVTVSGSRRESHVRLVAQPRLVVARVPLMVARNGRPMEGAAPRGAGHAPEGSVRPAVPGGLGSALGTGGLAGDREHGRHGPGQLAGRTP